MPKSFDEVPEGQTYTGEGTHAPLEARKFAEPLPSDGSLILCGDQVFYTVQGEGPTIGSPAVFVRLHFCNLRCIWCDTWYTWDKTTREYYDEPEPWPYLRIVEAISKYPVRRLVITGGEPLIQQRGIEQFLELIPDWRVEIETNGTLMPSPVLAYRCRFNCSPKTSNSENFREEMRKPDVLRFLNSLRDSCFKFVYTGQDDLAEIEEYIEECGLKPEKVFLMPEGTTPENIHDHLLEAAEIVKDRGWRLTPRLQVFAWGAVRGV